MTMTRNIMSEAARGLDVRIRGGTIPVFLNPLSNEPRDEHADTRYVEIAAIGRERTLVVGELSKMEQILEYLKALYR